MTLYEDILMLKLKNMFWCLVLISILILLLVSFLIMNFITPTQDTTAIMNALINRIAEYENIHNSVPTGLSQLPKHDVYNSDITDGWRRKIECIVQQDGFILLRSLGKNGEIGGIGANADIIMRFKVSGGKVEYQMLKVGDEVRREINWKRIRQTIADD